MDSIDTGSSETISTVPAGMNPAFAEKSAPAAEVKAETEATPAEKKEAAAILKKLKIRGKEMEVDDSKYHEYAQKGAAATETWQEAAKMKKEADAFMARLKSDPRSVLTDPNLGIDFRKVAEDFLYDKITEESLSPEQKAQRDKERRLEILEAQAKERAESESERERQAEHNHYRNEYDQKITKALTASGLPKTTGTVRRVAEYLRQDIQDGIDRDPAEYVETVRQDYIEDIKELISKLDGKTLIKMFGEETAKKMRISDLERLKSTTPAEGQRFVPGKGSPAADKPKKLSGKDWERDVMKSMMGR